MGAKFENPSNNYTEEVPDLAWLWTLLLGTIYFGVKGVWPHVFISIILAIVTGGLSWLIYPFFARKVIEGSYRKKGWKEVT